MTRSRNRNWKRRFGLRPALFLTAVGIGQFAAVFGQPSEPGSEPSAETAGVIEGSVVYESDQQRPWRYARYYVRDRKLGELAEAVVCLRAKSLRGFQPRSEPAEAAMDQKDYRFAPETLALRAGDRVQFTNSDPAAHNVRTDDGADPFNVTMGTEGSHLQTFRKAGGIKRPIRIGCALHSTMQAWIFVFDHPFYTVTASDGVFRFEGVPPGEYNIDMVHPAGGLKWTGTVTLIEGESTKLDIRVSPDDLIKEKP